MASPGDYLYRHSQLRSHPFIPRHYWESKVKEDPHLREDDRRGE